jgi:hypothetical protein
MAFAVGGRDQLVHELVPLVGILGFQKRAQFVVVRSPAGEVDIDAPEELLV